MWFGKAVANHAIQIKVTFDLELSYPLFNRFGKSQELHSVHLFYNGTTTALQLS